MDFSSNDLYAFLEEKHKQYNKPDFIKTDPISIPHFFTKKEDIEIAGFLVASFAWGNRKMILKNAEKLVQWMDYQPFEFLLNYSEKELNQFQHFTHRTFNGTDCIYFLSALRNIYKNHGGLEEVLNQKVIEGATVWEAIACLRNVFFELPFHERTRKHLADPSKNSAAKRINMFLRWMVRTDTCGVDFGIWKVIKPNMLYCPLDIHSGRVARKLGLLQRKANDRKAVEELTQKLREFDANDPVKYDFALFGLGVFEKF